MGLFNSPWGRYITHIWGGLGPFESDRERTFELLSHELESVYRVYNVTTIVAQLLTSRSPFGGRHRSSLRMVQRRVQCALQYKPVPPVSPSDGSETRNPIRGRIRAAGHDRRLAASGDVPAMSLAS
jgi:uncharacterized protein YfaP (DUF2135 family)